MQQPATATVAMNSPPVGSAVSPPLPVAPVHGGPIHYTEVGRQWIEPLPDNWGAIVLPKDAQELMKVFCELVMLNDAQSDKPTEVRVEAVRCDEAAESPVMWYNCIAFGWANSITVTRLNQVCAGNPRIRERVISLTAQGKLPQSKGAITLQVWSQDQIDKDARQNVPNLANKSAIDEPSTVQHQNGKRQRSDSTTTNGKSSGWGWTSWLTRSSHGN